MPGHHKMEAEMGLLGWAITALVISLIAGALGFTGVARGAASISKILFGLFLVIAVVLFIMVIVGIDILASGGGIVLTALV
jgi:uncharacterized membrane protein YtjA (UPF0391 family)